MIETHTSKTPSRSRENALDMGVMASFAVFSVSSRAPAMIVVSSWVKSPPFPAYNTEYRVDYPSTSYSC